MNNVLYSFLVSGIAGLSTMIGTIFLFFNYRKINKVICSFLAVAAGAMIMVSIYDLIPSAFKYLSESYFVILTILFILIFVVVGVVGSIIVDKIIPSGNGHSDNSLLFRTGIFSMIILMLHNIPEGIATFVTSLSNFSFGISLAIAISMHNIPEGICIAIPIYYATGSKIKAISYTFIAGISELIGAFIAYKFFADYMTSFLFSMLFSIIAGMMLYIVFKEIIPTSLKYGSKVRVVVFGFITIIIMLLSHVFLH